MKFPKKKKVLALVAALCMVMTLIPSMAFADTSGLPESEHKYANNYDNTWSYTCEGASNGVYVTFNNETEVESGYDFIIITDGNNQQIGKYTGTALAGKTIYVPTSSVNIRLTSDKSGNAYGFKVASVEACGTSIDLTKVGTVNEISPAAVGGTPNVTVLVNAGASKLTKDTDYIVSYSGNNTAGNNATAAIEGKGKYSGTITAKYFIYDDSNKASTSASVNSTNIKLRHTADWNNKLTSYSGASSYIPLSGASYAYLNAVKSITMEPVDKNGDATVTGSKSYPNAPKKINLAKDDKGTWDKKDGKWFVEGSNIYFYRTSEEPVVYVMEGHEPIDIKGRWSTTTYPQSQLYKVTVKAEGYEDITGEVTYYTGTAPEFSIIIDEDGDSTTTADQKVVKSWDSKEIEEMATFANGSSQCGMTGFRTFSGMGVSLNDLLKDAKVTVSDSDYFLLDTSDHYGNNFTYDELFGTTRYFLESVYDDKDVAKTYDELLERYNDSDTGAVPALRRLLAEKALEDKTTVEPRINVTYNETMLSGDNVGKTPVPTAKNVEYSSLVSYENQYRFFYGIALVQEDVNVTFDSQGGSDVAAQTVKSHVMTSTENTTIKSSYWANSLVIYRGAGEAYKTTPSTAADKITVPDNPTKEGFFFDGWYTDKNCTDGNKFDFTADGGTVDQDTTLFAKWTEITQADEDAAKKVEDMIEELPDDITLKDKDDIIAARDAYNALTDNQKTLVGNYDKLKSAIDAYNKLVTNDSDKITALGAEADAQSKTGDDFNMLPLIILMLLAAAAATGTIVYRRKNNA